MRSYEFTIVTDLYNEEDSGEVVLVKKNMHLKWFCRDMALITDIEQAYDDFGNIRENVTKIYHEKVGTKIVLGTYDGLKKMLLEREIVKGYK